METTDADHSYVLSCQKGNRILPLDFVYLVNYALKTTCEESSHIGENAFNLYIHIATRHCTEKAVSS